MELINGSTATDPAVRWQQRALRAESKLAELARMLDEHRQGVAPMPSYREIIRVLEA